MEIIRTRMTKYIFWSIHKAENDGVRDDRVRDIRMKEYCFLYSKSVPLPLIPYLQD